MDLSCQKIGARDVVFRDYELRSETAVRMPWYWRLDEKTRIAGCQMIRDAVQRVIEHEGLDTYKRFVREVIEEGRRSFETRVRQMSSRASTVRPRSWTYLRRRARAAGGGREGLLMHAPMEITVSAEGGFAVSFDGASKWGMHSFNAPRARCRVRSGCC